MNDLVNTEPLDLSTFSIERGTTLIEASAGTGKTYTIQYLVLDLLLKGVGLKEILVVTFTEAATKELRDRLQRFLTDVDSVIRGHSAPESVLKNVLERAIEVQEPLVIKSVIRRALLSIDEAAIYTIHGFCQRALQENAFAADASFETEVCADTKSVVDRLVVDFLRLANLELKVPLPVVAKTDKLVSRGLLLAGMLRVANPTEHSLSDISSSVSTAYAAVFQHQAELVQIEEELRDHATHLSKASYKPAFFDQLNGLLSAVFRSLNTVDRKDLEKLGSIKLQKSLKKASQSRVIGHPFFTAVDRLIEALDKYQPEFLRYFDSWFIDAINSYKSERSQVTYDDMIFGLERGLRESSALKIQLRKRYKAAFVDEFQDTDARQYAIFRALFAEDKESYFAMIGDPKQSIYSFRGADIDAYLTARLDSDIRLTLPTNFRSEGSTIEGVNSFFSGINFGKEGVEHSEILFERVEASDRSGKPELVFAEGIDLGRMFFREVETTEEEKVSSAAKRSLQLCVDDIVQLLGLAESGKVALKYRSEAGEACLRAIHAGDIAVLVDTHGEAGILQNHFQGRGVAAVRSKNGDVFATDEASHFLNFLHMCLQPEEQALQLLFVSPLYGKTDTELEYLSDRDRHQAFELFNRLGRLWSSGASVGTIWARFLDAVQVRSRLLGLVGGERQLTNYLHLGELALQREQGDSLSPEGLTDAMLECIKRGNAGDQSEGDASLIRLESDQNAVKIVTMHASKGLEFPIVFLPSLWQKPLKVGSGEVVTATEEDPDVYLEIVDDKEAIKVAQKSEALRIGYVAMTRAVHLTVYYAAQGFKKQRGNHSDGWFDRWMESQRGAMPFPESNLSEFIGQLKSAEALPLSDLETEESIQSRRINHRISSSYQITSYSALSKGEVTLESTFHQDPSDMAAGFDEGISEVRLDSFNIVEATELPLHLSNFPNGVRTGTCLHEILELIDFTNASEWKQVAEELVVRHFPESGVDLTDARVGSVFQMLSALVGEEYRDHRGELIQLKQLSFDHRLNEMGFYFPVKNVDLRKLETVLEGWAERNGVSYESARLASREIDGFLTGSIDLFFENNGRFYILDWKTNSPLPEMNRDQGAYTRRAMHLHMIHGRYYLQALIYSVAAAAFLRDRLGDRFNWEIHIGGFIYCFVRGIGEETGWYAGDFTEVEVEEACLALGQNTWNQEVRN